MMIQGGGGAERYAVSRFDAGTFVVLHQREQPEAHVCGNCGGRVTAAKRILDA